MLNNKGGHPKSGISISLEMDALCISIFACVNKLLHLFLIFLQKYQIEKMTSYSRHLYRIGLKGNDVFAVEVNALNK